MAPTSELVVQIERHVEVYPGVVCPETQQSVKPLRMWSAVRFAKETGEVTFFAYVCVCVTGSVGEVLAYLHTVVRVRLWRVFTPDAIQNDRVHFVLG